MLRRCSENKILFPMVCKRVLTVDWATVNGSSKKKRRISLPSDDSGLFPCPVKSCLHEPYKSQRGLRLHLNSRHPWIYYFDEEPTFDRASAKARTKVKLKASTHNVKYFSIDKGCGAEFVTWLCSPWGSDKALKDARETAKRAFKFLHSSLSEDEHETLACRKYIEFCLGSTSIFMQFLRLIIDKWELKASTVLCYLQAISDLCDFIKTIGCTDDVLRSFVVTEIYLRRSKIAMQRRKNLEYTRNLDLEALIARDSWSSIDQMLLIVPFHSPKYMQLVQRAKRKEHLPIPDLVYCTRFLCTYLFLNVKCTRPKSFQELTLAMIKYAGENSGFVDQTQFKTSAEYIYDSLKFTDAALIVVNSYIKHIRPLCKPSPDCDYVLVSTKGTQYTSLGSALSLLSFEAIGKYIHPTRYRQIVETASKENLTPSQQETLTSNQRHRYRNTYIIILNF